MIVVIPHTFGRHLNFNCHLHILVSEGGLREDGTQWCARARLDRKALMPMWRYAVITLLREAARAGVLETDLDHGALLRLLTAQYERWWNIDVKRFRSKKQFLGYAGRYARRPPIAQHRFRTISRQEIRFVTKDTRSKRTVETTYTSAEFLSALAHHVPDRYRHNVRYFGLLAPRVKSRTHDAVLHFWGKNGSGSRGDCGGQPPCRKASGLIHFWTATASGCAGLVACHRLSPAPRCPGDTSRRELTRDLRRSELICCPRARTPPSRSPNRHPPEIWRPPAGWLGPHTARRLRSRRRSSPEASERGDGCTLHRAPADDARLGPERTRK